MCSTPHYSHYTHSGNADEIKIAFIVSFSHMVNIRVYEKDSVCHQQRNAIASILIKQSSYAYECELFVDVA